MNHSHLYIPARHEQGFTLIEVILAVTVTAVITAALFTSMGGAFRTRSQAEDALSGRDAARAAVTFIRNDLHGVPPAGGRIGGVFIGEDQRESGNAEADRLTYVTTNPALKSDQDLADLRQIELELRRSADEPDYFYLARMVTGNLLAVQTPEPDVQVIARRVVSMSLRYYDAGVWRQEWDSTQRDNQIPGAVELTLVTAPKLSRTPQDDRDREDSYITTTQIIRLPAAQEAVTDGGINLGF